MLRKTRCAPPLGAVPSHLIKRAEFLFFTVLPSAQSKNPVVCYSIRPQARGRGRWCDSRRYKRSIANTGSRSCPSERNNWWKHCNWVWLTYATHRGRNDCNVASRIIFRECREDFKRNCTPSACPLGAWNSTVAFPSVPVHLPILPFQFLPARFAFLSDLRESWVFPHCPLISPWRGGLGQVLYAKTGSMIASMNSCAQVRHKTRLLPFSARPPNNKEPGSRLVVTAGHNVHLHDTWSGEREDARTDELTYPFNEDSPHWNARLSSYQPPPYSLIVGMMYKGLWSLMDWNNNTEHQLLPILATNIYSCQPTIRGSTGNPVILTSCTLGPHFSKPD